MLVQYRSTEGHKEQPNNYIIWSLHEENKQHSVVKTIGLERWLSGVLPEDAGSILSRQWLTTISSSSSKGSDALFTPFQVPRVDMIHRHACRQNTHTHKNYKNLQRENRRGWLLEFPTYFSCCCNKTAGIKLKEEEGHFGSQFDPNRSPCREEW